MANNLTLTTTLASPPSGSVFATDDVSGVHYPVGKLAFGPDDTATLVTATVGLPVGDAGGSLTVDAPVGTPVFVRLSDGSAAITTLPVSIAATVTIAGAVTNAGTFAVQESGAALTSLQIMDDWDESDRCKVNPIVGQAGVTGGAGAVDAATQRITIATDGNAIQGNVANAATDAGNPLKIGGKISTSVPTVGTNGNRVDGYFDGYGRLGVHLGASGLNLGFAAPADSLSVGNGFWTAAVPQLYNGSNTDRARNNLAATLLSSSARTASINSSDQTNYNGRGVRVTINCTANSSAAGITVVVKHKDNLSSAYTTLLTSAALFAGSATGTVVLTVYPGIAAVANLAANDVVGRFWRIEVTNGDASSITYSAGGDTIL